jgi:hypothetical protein
MKLIRTVAYLLLYHARRSFTRLQEASFPGPYTYLLSIMAASLSTFTDLLYANAGGRIYNTTHNYIYLEWLPGANQVEAYRALFEQVLIALRRTHTHRVLSDQRQMPVTSPEVQRWVAEEWLPRATREAGYSHCAVLLSQNVFARLAAVTWVSQHQPLPVTYRACASMEEAASWLLA